MLIHKAHEPCYAVNSGGKISLEYGFIVLHGGGIHLSRKLFLILSLSSVKLFTKL